MTDEELAVIAHCLITDQSDDADLLARDARNGARALMAALLEAEADRDRARKIAVALEQENAQLQAEVDKWWKATNDTGEALAEINRGRGAAQDRANAAEAKLRKVGQVRTWKNEDGKDFVFVEDLHEALRGGEAT